MAVSVLDDENVNENSRSRLQSIDSHADFGVEIMDENLEEEKVDGGGTSVYNSKSLNELKNKIFSKLHTNKLL